MDGSPQREIENRILKVNIQRGNSAFPFLSVSENSPLKLIHLFFTSLCVSGTKDKSTSSNVRKEGQWITNLTATDTFNSMLLFRICGKGTKQGGRSPHPECRPFTLSDLVKTEL